MHKLYNNIESNYELILSFFIKSDIINKAQFLSEIDIYDISNHLPLNQMYISASAELYIIEKEIPQHELVGLQLDIQSLSTANYAPK